MRYRVYFKLPPDTDVDRLVEQISRRSCNDCSLEADTVSKRTESIAANMENLSRYLTLAVFIAVLLSGVGVASVVRFATEKARSAALLRCIGAAPRETVCVYVIQVLSLAFVGSLARHRFRRGRAVRIAARAQRLSTFDDGGFARAPGIIAGWAVGLGTTLLFALIPLLPLRNISPLSALRATFDADRPARDWLAWILFALVGAGIWAFAVATTSSMISGSWFAGALLAVFGVLILLARAASAGIRKIALGVLPFAWRQGLANLHRPNNQTTAVTLAIGLGTFLLVTLYSVQNMLVAQVAGRAGAGEPNLVLFDVQGDQRQSIGELIKSQGISLRGEVPVVTMRLSSVKGQRVEELRANRDTRGFRVGRCAASIVRRTAPS